MDGATLRAELKTFSGRTANFHEHWSGLRFTDGINYLLENAKAQWLLAIIAVSQQAMSQDPWLLQFQLWEVFFDPETKVATVVCSRDSEDEAFRRKIRVSRFPLEYVRVYVEGTVMRLPTEH